MRTSRRSLVLLACLLLAPLARPTPQEKAGAALPEARALVERFAAVTKLGENLAKTSSRVETGKAQIGSIAGKTRSLRMKPARKLEVLEITGFGAMKSGSDGKVAWISSDMQGTFLLEGADLLQACLDASFDAALKPAAAYESMRTLGQETFADQACYKVEFVAKPLQGMDPEKSRAARTTIEYYAVESGLLLGIEGRLDGLMVSGPYKNTYSDYADFGGVLLPRKSRLNQGGVEVLLELESVTFDSVAEGELTPPDEVKKLLEPAPAKAQ